MEKLASCLACAPQVAYEIAQRHAGATKIDDGSMDAYLTAHFNIARMLSFRKADTPQKVQDLASSLARYKWLLGQVPALRTEAKPKLFEAELSIAQQMCELLPSKIDRLHYTGQDVSMSR